MTNILFKRGTSSNFNSLILKSGEPAFVTDLGKLYIGNGAQKILINPIDKPTGINTSNYYTKIKVNDYGQVIGQLALTSVDIPIIPSTQVSGLGTAALANTGTLSGNVPVLNNFGKIPDSLLSNPSYILAYYSGTNSVTVSANQFVPLSNYAVNGTAFTFDGANTITINEPGVYIVSYNITSSTLQMSTVLASSSYNNWLGTFARTSTTAIPSYVNTSVTITRQVTVVPEKFAIKNNGITDIIVASNYASLSIAKIK